MMKIVGSFALLIALSGLQSSCAHVQTKKASAFRDYDHAPDHVKQFYKEQHAKQTYAFASGQLAEINQIFSEVEGASEEKLNHLEKSSKIRRVSIWDAIKELDKLRDESDPDFSLPNSVHLVQTAERVRAKLKDVAKKWNIAEEKLDWMILAGLMHDIGKFDALLRPVPQWAVVGDTFPVGCQFSDKNIFHNDFSVNPDSKDGRYNTELGVYKNNVGLNQIVMSYGHDEFGYQVLRRQGLLPKEALSMIRFHSFYPLHRESAYQQLLEPEDRAQIEWVKEFSPLDLYSKDQKRPDMAELEPFYKKLINKYFPPKPNEAERKLIWPVLNPVK